MELAQYYKMVIRRAFSGKFLLAERVSGGAALFGGVVAWYFEFEHVMSWVVIAVFSAIFVGTVVVGLVVAPVQIKAEADDAHQKEKKILEEINRQLNRDITQLKERKPQFVPRLEHILIGALRDDLPGMFGCYIFVTIENIGAMSSIAKNFHMKMESNGEVHDGYWFVEDKTRLRGEGKIEVLIIEDLIDKKAAQPIALGGMIQGFYPAFFPILDIDFHNIENLNFGLFFQDVLNNGYSLSPIKTSPKLGLDLPFLPMIKYGFEHDPVNPEQPNDTPSPSSTA